ncbi:hypothetical protein CLAFUW4_08668 [Fulvia fulva]|uniref:Uncharacterized protein n=1 Tax=Passalora fulva TaxID=5499 RepID=A0A9Q8P736_PASFU|nr:uncharacterized protein CLAFUR5_08767 [Fulvia fulva]KAK4629622.1 hypothetical protein CLAFUR4_08670 [Fulvia fulva]KAK4629867.1 hypothetical protein CLAFUR0_08666 [Fulvia fulva]UJO15601.1 hypothetical protein CLAFUR5_08767 [Fulvia fulva]WPV12093.1 hypothetical protein CLAFUW4_08668 [Fulvia fulva]WPV27017.1 hypothetical protein CLAFUW7_08665 [Fulvia fulva]
MSSSGEDHHTTPSTADTTTPSSTSSEAPHHIRSSKEVKEHLENTVEYLCTCANDRTIYDVREYFGQDFVAVIVPPQKLTLDEYFSHLRSVRSVKPNVWIQSNGMSTVVDAQKGSARVFMDFEISGVYEGVVRPSVAVFKFRYGLDGKWRLVHYEAADGLSGMGSMP